MFLYKLSNTFLHLIGGMLELYTFSLIENCVSMHVLLQNIKKIKNRWVSLTDFKEKYDQLMNTIKCQLTGI